MYKHVFLDLDDTIWDFHVNAKISLQTAFDNLGLNTIFESFGHYFQIYLKRNLELWDLYGKGEITKNELQIERFGYPLRKAGIESEELGKKMGEMYLELLPEKTMLIPHARELLDYLAEKYTLSIISNGFVEVQHRKLKNSAIAHYFAHVILSDDVKVLKPDRKIFDYALELNNAKANEAIMIGDLFHTDILGAQNASIDQIFFNRHKKGLNENETATHVVDSLKEVFEIL